MMEGDRRSRSLDSEDEPTEEKALLRVYGLSLAYPEYSNQHS